MQWQQRANTIAGLLESSGERDGMDNSRVGVRMAHAGAASMMMMEWSSGDAGRRGVASAERREWGQEYWHGSQGNGDDDNGGNNDDNDNDGE